MADDLYCEHDRTAASCEECVHAAALSDPRRAPATRDELYPFPEGGLVTSAFAPDEADEEPAKSRSRKRLTARRPSAGTQCPPVRDNRRALPPNGRPRTYFPRARGRTARRQAHPPGSLLSSRPARDVWPVGCRYHR